MTWLCQKKCTTNTFLVLNPPWTKFCSISIVFVLYNVEGARAFVFCIAHVFYHVFNLCELSMFVVFTCCASFCLLCELVVKVFFWLGKVRGGTLAWNLQKHKREKVWVQRFWFWSGQIINFCIREKMLMFGIYTWKENLILV